ncbi:hypothetical protein ACH5RR_013247 [Cinchona calisaya]|uniref:Uncharacterized protein n=1 Tax=Cinchona calisaya TaxID=153742 RepID=A0ABD3A2S8_9GENT
MEIMSSEELKIRGELEKDVERELEEEIKERICHLAFRLQRLYQQQKERNIANELTTYQQGTTNNKILYEVNINIKMEGGTKIEIKEIKKQLRENRIRNPKTESVRRLVASAPSSAKKFDWANSLRSGPSTKIDCLNQSRTLSSRAKTNAPQQQQQQRKVNMDVNRKVLELGWKD